MLDNLLTKWAFRFSSKNIFSGSMILPFRTQRSSVITLWFLRIRQFLNLMRWLLSADCCSPVASIDIISPPTRTKIQLIKSHSQFTFIYTENFWFYTLCFCFVFRFRNHLKIRIVRIIRFNRRLNSKSQSK